MRPLQIVSSSALIAIALACGAEVKTESSEPVVPQYDGHIALKIGQVEGDEAYLFGAITGIARDSLGRLFIADAVAHEVRVFDASGRFLFRFGREGQGPGDLGWPCCLAFGPDGALWVREARNERYSVFDIGEHSAEFRRVVTVRSVPGGAVPATNVAAPITFDRAGRLMAFAFGQDSAGNTTLVRLHAQLTGTVDSVVVISRPPLSARGLHPVAATTSEGRGAFMLGEPFRARHLVAHGPEGRWAEALGSSYRIELHDPEGRLIVIKRPEAVGPLLSDSERRVAAEKMEAQRQRYQLRSLPYGLPERKPVLKSLFFDVTGRLWVERHVEDVHPAEADVYDTAGRLAAVYSWPAEVRVGFISWVSLEMLWGVVRDSLDVPQATEVCFSRVR